MSGSRTHPPRWPPQCSCVVIESSFDPGERLQAPGNLLFLFTCRKLMRHYVLPFSVFLPLSVHPLLVYFSLFWPNVLLSFCITLSNIHTRQWCIVNYVPVCSVSYYSYYYVTPNAVGWRIAILHFFFTIIIIILPHIFVRSISRRCLNQTLWNLVGISYAMWSCAGKGWFFPNGCRCHGNGQNAKKLKNTKMIIAGYSPNRNWWNLIGTTSTSSGTR